MKIGGRYFQILTHNELDLSFPAPNDCAKFQPIRFKIATAGGAITDTQTRTDSDRRQRSYNLSHVML